MRRKQAAIALTLVVAAFAVGAPVLLALQEAQRQGRAIETERVLGYARDVLMRTDATAAQVDRGFKLLAAARNGAPCSEANIDLMRQIDVTSSYIQAIGYVEDGRIACSSIGGDRKDLLFGTPDFVTANGVAGYKNLRLPFAPQQQFIALARNNHVAIIHKDLPIDTTVSGADVSLAAAIRTGLKRNELFLLYQPIVDLESGEWVGAEALIRWQRPTGELVDPNIFIPIAEKSGLIEQVTQRVLELAARDTGAFLRRHPRFYVAVNLSAADLHSPRLPAQLDDFLSTTAAAPGNLVVEITERGLLNVELAREMLRTLRAKGVRVAIDDFGTGYSGLSYLQTLEVDYLKIDKTFVDAIATEAPTSHVVQHIIEMAKSLKLKLTAEGVETEAQARFLRQHGVEYAQGWLFAKPMKFVDIERVLAARA